MYLKTVTIRNFRSLKDVTVELDEKDTVLIGENNAGKTSFMDAIRIALTRTSGRYSFEDYDYYMDENNTSPKDSDGIEIIMIFQERVPEEWNGYIMDTFGEVVQFIGNEKERGALIIKVSSVYNSATMEFESKGSFLNHDFQEIAGRVQAPVKLNDFYKLVPVFYLQALRNIHDTFSSRSPLWGRFLKKANIPQDKLKELQDSMEELNKDIIQSDENLIRLVSSLEEVQKVLDFQGDDLVAINALPVKSWELLSKAQIVLSNTNHISFPLEKHGQGTQSVTTILLFKAYIDILLRELNNENSEALLMVEEPEAHLHPQAIRAVEKVLEELECQKVVTTHSPYFLQNCDLLNLRLF
ncbi:MAG: AAA family ATPase, partial [Lachnospiraceae bacterium]|nr:AAA family ATPase [Lachnospiraceae bacterium]